MSKKNEISLKKSTLWQILSGVLVLVIVIIIIANSKDNYSYQNNNVEQQGNAYKPSNKVDVPKDTEGDGLTDVEERSIGTNPQLYDTDGDTLSDYEEVKITKTNPLKKNTDGDRYNDNEDEEPLKKNSAVLEGRITNYQIQPNYVNIGILVLTGGLSYTSELYSTEVYVEVTNTGDDYTSFVNYDLVLLIGSEIINKETVSLGRINQGETKTNHFSFSTSLSDIPSQLINYITEQTSPIVEVRNGNYERF